MKKFTDVGVQTDAPKTTMETSTDTEDPKPLPEIDPAEDVATTAAVETLPSLPSTVAASSVYVYRSPPLKPMNTTITVQPKPSEEKRASWRFPRRKVFNEKTHFSVSACPEVLATHVSEWCSASDTVVDPFCGVGRLAIQLARKCRRVIAVDIDPAKIATARRNAAAQGVADRIDFRVGDSFLVLSGVKAHAVITSPPWAAPAWDRYRRFDVQDICGRQSDGLAGVLRMAGRIAPRVALHVPKTIHMSQTVDVSRHEGFGRVQFEDVTIDGWKNAANTVLYLQKSCDWEPPFEPVVSQVVLYPKSSKSP